MAGRWGWGSQPAVFAIVALVLASGGGAAAQLTPPSRPAAAAATPPVPALPAWAALLNLTSPNRSALRTYNARLVAAANASSITYDIAFYGDSLTGLTVLIPDNAMVWGAHFGAASGLRAARLGLGGSTVEELAWRLAAGGEKPARDPLVAVLLIGVNNRLDSRPADKLDWLLGWMRATMPGTRLLVVAPLPSVLRTSAALRAAYLPVVARHPGVQFSTCGSALNPANTTQFTDGLHLTPIGYEQYFTCLKPQVAGLVKRSQAARALAAAALTQGP